MSTTLSPSPQLPRHRILVESRHRECGFEDCRVEGDGRTTVCPAFACPACGSSDVQVTGDGGMDPVWFCCTCAGEWLG